LGGIVLEAQGDRAAYLLVTAAEEGLEMAGSVLLLYAGMCLLRLRPEPGRISPVDRQPRAGEQEAAARAEVASHRRSAAPSRGR
jgi:hypothetical protein